MESNGETYFLFYSEPAWFVCVNSRISDYDDAVKSKKCFLKREDNLVDLVNTTNEESESQTNREGQTEHWQYSVLQHDGLLWIKDRSIRMEQGEIND